MLRGQRCALLILLAAVAAAPAFSTTVTWYTSQATWEAAVSGLFKIDFNSAAPNAGDYAALSGWTFGDATDRKSVV